MVEDAPMGSMYGLAPHSILTVRTYGQGECSQDRSPATRPDHDALKERLARRGFFQLIKATGDLSRLAVQLLGDLGEGRGDRRTWLRRRGSPRSTSPA